MKNAINVTLLAIVAALLFLVSDDSLAALGFDEDYYNECTLKNVKPGMDRSAIQLIHQACKHKATPKKCRALSDHVILDPFGPPDDKSERSQCVDACKTENYYSRTFGDCSTG
jgi:hypothetical protein